MKLNLVLAAALLTSGVSAFADVDTSKGVLTGKGSFAIADSSVTGSFTDTFDFTVNSTTKVSYLFSSELGDNEITGLSAVLTGGAAPHAGTAGEAFGYQGFGDKLMLGAGTYVLTIKGVGDASSYGGTLNYSVSAVPEPASVALLMAGLGLVGFVAKRRKQA